MWKPHSVSQPHSEEAGGGEARALRAVPSDVLLTGSFITCLEAGSGSTRMARCWLSCCRHSEGPLLQASLTVIGSRGAAVPQPTCLPTSTLTVRLWEQWASRPVSLGEGRCGTGRPWLTDGHRGWRTDGGGPPCRAGQTWAGAETRQLAQTSQP